MSIKQQLTAADRGAIEVLLKDNYTLKSIGDRLGFNKSTVSREINKRSTPNGYDAKIAQASYERSRAKCGAKKKLRQTWLQKQVISKLRVGDSPEQIAGRLKLENGKKTVVCHETIYAWIYEDNPWTDDEADLYQYLRLGRKKRKKQKGRGVHKSKIPNRVSISQRPDVISQKVEFGHFEGDSVLYVHKQAISTQNELLTGKVTFTKLKRKTAKLTATAHSNALKKYQDDGMDVHTLTLDNGSEHTNHEDISKNTGVKVYFAHPYCSCERGANENVNMLLRGYLPKRANITHLTQDELDDIAEELNNRPRKRLGYYTPNEVYNSLLTNSRKKAGKVAFKVRM